MSDHPSDDQNRAGAERGLTRFEGFTDAVFAIALTLLVVELPSPGAFDGPPTPDGLAAALAEEWRAYVGLGVSFAVIGVYWLQHHYSGRIYRRTDHLFSLANLIFLFGVAVSSWAVRIWADHLGEGADERTGATLLAAVLAIPALGWMLKWLYAVGPGRLVDERLDPAFLRRMTWQYGAGALAMTFSAATAIVWPVVGLTAALAITAAFGWPPPSVRYKPGQDPDMEEVEDDG